MPGKRVILSVRRFTKVRRCLCLDDKELVRRIQNGQKEYLNVIADRYYDDIYNFCCYHSGNREDAYDLAQETFLRFIRYVGQYKYVNLKGYLLTVAMNVCRNYYRDKKEETDRTAGEQEAPEDAIHREYPPGKYSGQDGYSRLEYCMVLKNILAKIPEAQREAVILHHFYGYKNREIARMTGASCAAVKSRVNQGLAQLRRLLEKEDLYE